MTTAIDKGKQKDDDGHPKTHGSTLFVSNLPYTATSVDLQTLFSDIAPVRSAFVVTEHGTGVSKGVGYVSFALKEDAETAFEGISQSGIELVGRKLRVQWAENKKRGEKGENEGIQHVKEQKLPRVSVAGPPHDPVAIRTTVISGLPHSIDSKVLWKKIRKYDGAEKVWLIQSELKEEASGTAHAVFSTPAQAAEAVNKLHAHVYKGSLLSVTLKKRMDNLVKPTTSQKCEKTAVAAPSHASRLIVRNIPFNATEQDIRAIFLPYGPIHSIHIPLDNVQSSDTKSEVQSEGDPTAAVRKPRTKGFAFVWMLSKKDAEKAIQGCNGTVLRAGVAQSLVSDKQKTKKERRLEAKKLRGATIDKEGGGGGGGGENTGEKVENGQEERVKSTDRIIAVDWALSKDRWEEERAKMEGIESSESDTSDSDDSDDGSETNGMHDEENDSESSNEEEESDEERVKPQLPPPETGTTVFIRNIPFDATEDELRTLFRSFGPLRYARITKDPATGRSRGSGFACFWNEADANCAVQQSELLQTESAAQTTVQKKNPFSLPSILTPDPSSSLAQNLVLHGRTLDVVMAVTRDVAGKLKEDNEKARQKLDKRNMHLLREGVILPNSPGAETLTPAEVEKRTTSFNARRALLKTNPSLYISKTRLSVRHIPTFVTERMLKRLALHSIKAFNAEVKQGTRDALDVDELDGTAVSNSAHVEGEGVGKDDDDHSPKRKKFKGKESAVKQAKIVRQAERVDPITGKGKSKGYGFVEFHKHSDALKFLRWANNNPEVTALCNGRWWKEELESLLKTEKETDKMAEDDGLSGGGMRMKRLREEINRADGVDNNESKRKKSKGTLVVEFSIENAQVVQRRNAKQQDSKPGNRESPNKKRKRDSEAKDQDSVNPGNQPPPKKQRASPSKLEQSKDKAVPTKTKFANPMGSIIGRKRKERRKDKK